MPSLLQQPSPATSSLTERAGSTVRSEGLFRRQSVNDRILLVLFVIYSTAAIASNAAPQIHLGSVEKIVAAPFIGFAFLTLRPRLRSTLNVPLAALLSISVLSFASYFWSMTPRSSAAHATVFLLIFVGSLAEVMVLKRLGTVAVWALALGLMIGAELSALQVLWAAAHHTFVNVQAYEAATQRVTAGNANPNDVAITFAMVLPVFFFQKRTLVRLLGIPLVIAAVLTGSRTGLLCMIPTFFGMIAVPTLFKDRDRVRRRIKRRAMLQGFVIMVAAFVVGLRVLPAKVLQRLGTIPSQFHGGNFTGRTILWRAAWNGFLDRPFSGYGSGTSSSFELQHTGLNLVTHQTLLALLLELGVLGGVVFLIGYGAAVRGAFRHVRQYPWYVLLLLSMTVGMAASAWDYNKIVWLILVLGGFFASVSEAELVRLDRIVLAPARPRLSSEN